MGNLARNSGVLLVSPKTKFGAISTSRPLMLAAARAFVIRGCSIVVVVWMVAKGAIAAAGIVELVMKR